MNVGDLITRFENLRRARSGWTARCPAHADRENSLSLRIGDNGRLLVNCFASCRPAEIVGAVGLALRDLFPEGNRSRTPGRPAARLSAMDEARREILREARRQPWARPGVRLQYAAADLFRGLGLAADQLQRLATARGPGDAMTWRLMEAAVELAREAFILEAALDGMAA